MSGGPLRVLHVAEGAGRAGGEAWLQLAGALDPPVSRSWENGRRAGSWGRGPASLAGKVQTLNDWQPYAGTDHVRGILEAVGRGRGG